MGGATPSKPLLSVQELVVDFATRGFGRARFCALSRVSLEIGIGESVGLVGESGSGKTTFGRAVLGLVPVASGSIRFAGEDIAHLTARERRRMADQIQVVFQDPYSSLNPAMTVEQILLEPLTTRGVSLSDGRARIRELLDQVGLPSDSPGRLAREFSGGQRQRVAIARALALRPRLIVCDEPVSALDLTTQARVLQLFQDVQRETGVSYLFISHDLSVVRHISDRIAVMYRGRIVEAGPADVVTSTPADPYTRRLLLAAPLADPDRQAERRELRRRSLADI